VVALSGIRSLCALSFLDIFRRFFPQNAEEKIFKIHTHSFSARDDDDDDDASSSSSQSTRSTTIVTIHRHQRGGGFFERLVLHLPESERENDARKSVARRSRDEKFSEDRFVRRRRRRGREESWHA